MAYPTIYDVTYSYSVFQQSQGNNAFPGTQVDADFAGLADSLANISTFMQGVMRSDGALQNGIVTIDSLAPGLALAGMTPANAWATGVVYFENTSVVQSSKLYRAILDHTSGVFATDLGAGKWLFVGDLTAGPTGPIGPVGPTPLQPVAPWTTATAYVVGPPAAYVSQGGSSYQCLVNHTSGVFATDLAAGKWGIVAQAGGVTNTGTAGQFPYYAAAGSTLDPNPSLFFGSGKFGVFNTSPQAQFHIGNSTSNSASVSVDTVLMVDRAVDDTGIGGHAHGVSDSSTMNRSGVFGYASFDARVQYIGTKSYDHHIGFQSYQLLGTTGTINERYGFFDGSSLTAGTVTKWAGFRATAPAVSGTGSIGTIHGVLVDDLSAASANVYAVKTEGAAKSSFGGNVGIGTTSPSSVSTGGAGRVAEIAGAASYATLSLSSSGGSGSNLGGILEAKSTASLSGGDSRLGNLFWLRAADVTAGKLTASFSIQTTIDGTLVLSAQSGAGGSFAIKGTTTNDSAAAGQVGEYVSGSRASGSALGLVTNTETTIASMSLTAGDWDVEGTAAFAGSTRSYLAVGPNTTTNTLPAPDNYSGLTPQATAVVADNVVFPRQRFSLSTTTTIYLVVKAGHSASCSAYGSMTARRVR